MASKGRFKDLRRERVKRGIRKKMSGTATKPRLTVYRSNTSVYAQLVDDLAGKTIVGLGTSKKLNINGTKTEQSREIGKRLAQKAIEKGIQEVVFDRNGYLYHGRIKALADGAREAGLKF